MILARQATFNALQRIYQKDDYTDLALDSVLRKHEISTRDRSLATELVYGIVRRQRTLDHLIDTFGKKKASQQPPHLRIILHLGFYQLRYLTQIPPSAAVNTSVELAKSNGLKKLSGVVNGMLRQYIRLTEKGKDPLTLPNNPISRLGILHSFPDWMIQMWIEQLGLEETEKLCEWFNSPPSLDLRVNPLRTSIDEVESKLITAGVNVSRLPLLSQALRITGGAGNITKLPGFVEGEWTIQDSSAQLVSHVLNPQPGEVVIDACAAPGGKTTHIAELMGDEGKIWACDRAKKRLTKVEENAKRLQLHSIATRCGDIRHYTDFTGIAHKVLVDAPCSGLGTLHKRPDLRWRQTEENTQELSQLQRELLEQAATWVQPKGVLLYSTCTLNEVENEDVIQSFLSSHPEWEIMPPSPTTAFTTESNYLKILPHQHDMDGFFIAKLYKRK